MFQRSSAKGLINGSASSSAMVAAAFMAIRPPVAGLASRGNGLPSTCMSAR